MLPDDAAARLDRLARSAHRTGTAHPGGRMAWHEWGDGPPAVLLHGGAGSWRHWTRNIEALLPHRRLLLPDMPGLGDSDLPPDGTDLPGYAALVAEAIERRTEGVPYDLVGFSFGATVAGAVSARPGARARSLALLGCSHLGLSRAPVPLASVRNRAGEDRERAHRDNLASLMIHDPAHIDAEALAIQAWNSDHARFRSRSIVRADALREALDAVQIAPAVIDGAHDALVGPHRAERTAFFQARGVNPLIVPDAGHWVAFEGAKAVNEALLRLWAV